MWNIVWHMKHKIASKTHIYMRNIVWHIHVLQKAETFIILEASGLPKAETFTIFHSPMFAKSLQKSSKHVQPRNSSVEYLWNIKKCSFEGLRSPGGSCLKACSCHVGGWFV